MFEMVYLDFNAFLQAAQHKAIFSLVTILASFIICFHVATFFRKLPRGTDSSISMPQ